VITTMMVHYSYDSSLIINDLTERAAIDVGQVSGYTFLVRCFQFTGGVFRFLIGSFVTK